MSYQSTLSSPTTCDPHSTQPSSTGGPQQPHPLPPLIFNTPPPLPPAINVDYAAFLQPPPPGVPESVSCPVGISPNLTQPSPPAATHNLQSSLPSYYAYPPPPILHPAVGVPYYNPPPPLSPAMHMYRPPSITPPSQQDNPTKESNGGYRNLAPPTPPTPPPPIISYTPYSIPPPIAIINHRMAETKPYAYDYNSYDDFPNYGSRSYGTGSSTKKWHYSSRHEYHSIPPQRHGIDYAHSSSSASSSVRDYTSRGAHREWDRDKERERERDRERERSNERDRRDRGPREKERERGRAGDRERERADRDVEREKHRNRPETERDRLLKSWRANYCETPEDMNKKLAEMAALADGADGKGRQVWTRSSPADLFYRRTEATLNEMLATVRLDALCQLFDTELIQRADRVRSSLPPYEPPTRKPRRRRLCKHKSEACSSSSSTSSSSDGGSSDEEFKIEQDCSMEELSRKLQHPYRIHADLWHNDPGEMNDGPLCRCSAKSRRIGIRHGIYPGEKLYTKCAPNSNNAGKLHHYRITISPPTNFLTKTPTMIKHDEHEFLFEGFSLFAHKPLGELPTCKVIRFNIEYTILYEEEKMPDNFTIRELDLFTKYLFHELLELIDFTLVPNETDSAEESCPAFHFMPRFVRDLPDNGKEVLAMCEVLKYLLDNAAPLVDKDHLCCLDDIGQTDWQDYIDFIKGMLVTKPGYKPCSVRVDQLDRNVSDLPECVDAKDGVTHPAIVHFGIRPPQLSYAGNPEYQKAWREYVKFRHLMANMSKPSFKDKRKLEEKETRLHEMRTQGRMKRNVTVAVSSKGYYRTGINCDVVQHAMLVPVLTGHLRFHQSLDLLEESIGYKFTNRYLLQLALTHPSYKENYGTNPDHARNSLTNCGIRQPEYGDRKIHYMNTRKRGINTLINIMSRFGKEYETMSNITHNERLEFLGDAVVEFLSSIHLFFMFPELEEGGLATYRAAIVQNQHLALLARKLRLEEYMLYAHGSDLCHELELRHAMANCFEALMGALLLDGGISVADNVFLNALFLEDDRLREIWKNYPEHPLQEQEPMGDRGCIPSYPVLQELTKFEDAIGIKFKHIRLLARAFTDRSIGFTHLTLGSNQRLEFLGDTVLQLICSEYLYRHFPEHHEGHLSLLRSSLVNNRTQAVVCDDLGMTKYAVYSNPKAELKTKDRADLLEAFLGSLYVDKGLLYCEQFCHVCLFPRLQMFIMNQDWNDPKSKLQQCCLTLRTMDGGEPDIPIYKVIESIGPTNTRVYTVAVYFRSKRLATATGSSIQQAEMNAAKQALENSRDLFPQLDHQKRVIVKSIKKQTGGAMEPDLERMLGNEKGKRSGRSGIMAAMDDESHLPKQYRIREDISSDELPEDDRQSEDDVNNAEDETDRDSTGELSEKENANGRVKLAAKKGYQHIKDSETSSDCSNSNGEYSPKRQRRIKKRARNSDSSYSSSSPKQVITQPPLPKIPALSQPPLPAATVLPPLPPSQTPPPPSLSTSNEICEDVSSDDCFDDTSVSKEKTNGQATTIITNLQDLVEDVSSNSCFESGEEND